MRSRKLFWASLAAVVLIQALYGLKRFTLGVDFTDEGAYVSWPMRMLFGEKLFESEPLTLLRPLQALLFLVFKLHPATTLYEFRLLGWSIHLFSFSILSIYLFRLSEAPLQSPLIANVPFFICNIFGLAAPSYNSLSSDFLLVALCLRGLSFVEGATWKKSLNLGSGLALFLATLAHPGLGLVAAIILLRELLAHHLVQNLLGRRLTGSNVGVLVFVSCWLGFFIYLAATGALTLWVERTTLFNSFTVTAKNARPGLIYYHLAIYPFSYSRFALLLTLASLITVGVVRVFSLRRDEKNARRSVLLLGLLLSLSLICTSSFEADFLTTCFALVSLFLIGVHASGVIQRVVPTGSEIRFLLLTTGLAGGCYATLSFYFSPYRSWISGVLALPFAFSVGLTLLLRALPPLRNGARILFPCSLVLAGACAAGEHYRNIYRDAAPVGLQTPFRAPKLNRIKSTEERVQAVDAFYDYLKPKLARGAPLLAFDDCPMLYFLLDARPAYGLTWAVRYTQRPASLQRLNRELLSKPLPLYAIRTTVDLSSPVWNTALRINYDDYPLNETVMANYELEKTIFPFEIWHLKPGQMREKPSPVVSTP